MSALSIKKLPRASGQRTTGIMYAFNAEKKTVTSAPFTTYRYDTFKTSEYYHHVYKEYGKGLSNNYFQENVREDIHNGPIIQMNHITYSRELRQIS